MSEQFAANDEPMGEEVAPQERTPSPMRLSWKIGRLAGIDLYLHASALLIFWITSGWFPTGLQSVAYVLALFASIVLHELGHALMARRYGIATTDITLYLFGGVARLTRIPRSAGPELLIAIAGPAVTFAIVLVLASGIGLIEAAGFAVSPVLVRVLELNLVLGLFNLLPIFPMDGGRVLRALLSHRVGRLRATEVAATIGRYLAIVLGAFFLLQSNYLALTVPLYVYFAGSLELAAVRNEARPQGAPPGFVNIPPAPAGYQWVSGGDGVWRQVPIMVNLGRRGRSWS